MSQGVDMQISQLVCLGLNHRTATIELRERFSRLPLLLEPHAPVCAAVLRELVILSTCNRVELYAYVHPHVQDARTALIDLLAATHDIEAASFVDHLYFYQGDAAVEHLCRVASGLDSLV